MYAFSLSIVRFQFWQLPDFLWDCFLLSRVKCFLPQLPLLSVPVNRIHVAATVKIGIPAQLLKSESHQINFCSFYFLPIYFSTCNCVLVVVHTVAYLTQKSFRIERCKIRKSKRRRVEEKNEAQKTNEQREPQSATTIVLYWSWSRKSKTKQEKATTTVKERTNEVEEKGRKMRRDLRVSIVCTLYSRYLMPFWMHRFFPLIYMVCALRTSFFLLSLFFTKTKIRIFFKFANFHHTHIHTNQPTKPNGNVVIYRRAHINIYRIRMYLRFFSLFSSRLIW